MIVRAYRGSIDVTVAGCRVTMSVRAARAFAADLVTAASLAEAQCKEHKEHKERYGSFNPSKAGKAKDVTPLFVREGGPNDPLRPVPGHKT